MSDAPDGTREVLYEGRWLRLMRDRDWEYIVHRRAHGIVVMIACTPERELLLVEQERIPLGARVLELPAGMAGDGPAGGAESLADAAARELLEETGYATGRTTYLFKGPVSPGRSSDLYHFFLMEDLAARGAGGGDATEDIRVHRVPLRGICAWLRGQAAAGLLVDPKIYIALHVLGVDTDRESATNAPSLTGG
ncbi:MAG TPA: NUDIX hydrolase [Kiritimatiellia bacterium]|nr:NUDIX hydrolase [Kiritimatiellia bacterium]